MNFAELDVPDDLVAALDKQQIVQPTPIQVEALPLLLQGRDAYLNAETGTGKTLAYLLPIFCRLDAALDAVQAMVVAPTHELAIQIHRQCTDLAQNAGRPVRSLLLIGGTSLDRQREKLKKKPHLVVGSPGRILELIAMRKLKTLHVRSVVIDEADRLLVEESLPAIRSIIEATPRGRQLIFASATVLPESAQAVMALAPDRVMIRAGASAVNENIEHLYMECEEREKPALLRKLLHALQPERAMVFVHRNETAQDVASKLAHHGIPAAVLHAASDKRRRKQSMDDFRSARLRVLVTSDVAARGLDIQGISHVVNLDAPAQSRAYLHRVGRTARAGAKGVAVTLLTGGELRLVQRYQKELEITLEGVRLREGRLIPAGPASRPDQRRRPVTKRR